MDILTDHRISGTLKNHYRGTAALSKALTEKGIETLGNGVQAVAIEHKGRCYKLMPNGSNGHELFIEIIKDIDSIHLPVIYDKQRIGHFVIVEMELLQEIDFERSNAYQDWLNDRPAPAEYMAVKQLLMEEAFNRGIRFDLHNNNVMQRSDGTPVIVDPFFS